MVSGQDNQISIEIPSQIETGGQFVADLYVKDPVSPKILGLSDDDRLLGVGLISAVFR